MTKKLWILLAVVALTTMLTGAAAAQGRAEGSIVGTVTDETKGVLPGVTVTATNPATGFSRETVTDAEGQFVLPALPPAPYEVMAALTGFSTFKGTVTVSVGAEARVAISLTVGSVQENVTVTGETALVETTKTEQGTQFNENEVQNLPMTSRSFLEFALLAPGVVRARAQGDGFQGNQFSTSGNRNGQNQFNIDGLNNKNMNGGGDRGRISPAAIQEFQIVTQSFPAEYGGAAGGVTNAVTKSGTNALSGSGFLFQRNETFDKPPFNTRPTAGTDSTVEAFPVAAANFFRRQIAGFTLGGPVRRDKMFYFFVLDTTRTHQKRLRTVNQNAIDAVRQLAFPEIPDTPQNEASDYKPWEWITSTKVDYTISQRHNANINFATFRDRRPAGSVNGRSSVYTTTDQRAYTTRVGGSLNSFLSDKTLNTFRVLHDLSDQRTNYPNRGGFDNLFNWDAGLVIAGSTGGNFGLGELGTLPHNHQSERKIELQDTMTMFRDKHTVKFGGAYMWVDALQYSHYYGLGEWRFSDLAAFRAGQPSGFIQSFGSVGAYIVANHISGFIQDEWQPRSNLTVNAGVRYDFVKLPGDLTRIELPEPAFNSGTGKFDTNVVSNSYMTGFKNDTNNVAPRLGFSWSADDKTVVRLGGGLFFGAHHYGEMDQGLGNSLDGYERYDFPSVEATAIWAGLHNPTSIYYNRGEMRLAQSYRDQNLAGKRPFSIFSHPADLKTPQSLQASLGVERQLMPWLSASGNLLFNKGEFSYRSQNINPPEAVFYPAGSTLPSGRVTPHDVNYRPENGPRQDPTRANIYTYRQVTRIRYKGASASLNARFSGLQVRGSYTFNDTWDDGSDVSTRLLPSDSDCVPCEYSKSVQSTTHNFRGSAVYQLPSSLPIWARDWQLSTVLDFEGGHPSLVISSFDFNNDNVITDRPFGVPRTGLWTDGFYSADLRVARFIPIRGKVRAEVIFEMFNFTNTIHFSNWDQNLYRFVGGRYLPYADFVAYNATAAVNQGFNQGRMEITPAEIGLDREIRRNSVDNPRQGQLAFRLHF